MPTDARLPPPLNASRPIAHRLGGLPSAGSYENLGGRSRGSPDFHGSRLPRCSSLSALASSGTATPASGFYSEMLHCNQGSGDMKSEHACLQPPPPPPFIFRLLCRLAVGCKTLGVIKGSPPPLSPPRGHTELDKWQNPRQPSGYGMGKHSKKLTLIWEWAR